MKTIQIPETELSLTPIGLGCAEAGMHWDTPDSYPFFERFLELGGNLIDTARIYNDWATEEKGRSERVIGDWIRHRGHHEDMILLTKGGHPLMSTMHNSRVTRDEMRIDLELSLKALGVDCIDMYCYHRDNTDLPVGELIDIMETFVREGKIRFYGCSNWSTARMRAADRYAAEHGCRGFSFNEALFNFGCAYMKPMADDTLQTADAEMLCYHKENPKNLLIPYTSNCSGFFHKLLAGKEGAKESPYYTPENIKRAEIVKQITEKYNTGISQVLLGYLMTHDPVTLPLIGVSSIPHMEEAMQALEIPFTASDYTI